MSAAPPPSPVEISRSGESDVRIRWSDGKASVFPARFLRLACRCAHCVDEMTGRRVLQESSVPQDVRPLAIAPVGRYAIEIQWSDGHRTGIYTWDLLYRLAGQLPGF
ncbi:MAG: hypothetical protein A3H28_02505 [Acidobacteria bacterium RIFCSPLOWO2_02_FULL_61_28]|nr:MAG: hypothetical protein A3H28_02505 [Acidobacteria bacterium RIFCSPLOWO2_02_FULL_61_28]